MPRLYVGRLPNRSTERDVEKFFKNFGRLREVNLKNGYAFVDFEDHRDADDAAYELNGREMMGERIIVEHAKGIERTASNGYGLGRNSSSSSSHDKPKTRTSDRYGPPLKTQYRVTVQNLSTRVSWQDLKDYCRQAGEVTYADAHKNRKREACVCFATKEDMKNVIRKLEGTDLNGRKLKFVEEYGSRSRSRSPRYRKRSHSRSRSRSQSRSRSRTPRSRSPSRSRSRSRSPVKRSKKHSPSRSRSRSRSRSPTPRKADRSRSRSRSPQDRNDKDKVDDRRNSGDEK